MQPQEFLEVDRIWHHIFHFSRQAFAAGGYPLEKMGILDITVLCLVRGHEQVSIKEITETLCLAKSTMTSICKRLEAQGLIARSVSPQDRRSALLTLTTAGAAVIERHEEFERIVYAHVFTGLEENERRELIRLLKQGCGLGV